MWEPVPAIIPFKDMAGFFCPPSTALQCLHRIVAISGCMPFIFVGVMVLSSRFTETFGEGSPLRPEVERNAGKSCLNNKWLQVLRNGAVNVTQTKYAPVPL